MLSKACEYGIRAVVYIASESKGEARVGIQEICTHIDAPQHFTAKILQVLSRQGIVSSQKGVHGGFYLTMAQRKLPMYHVVAAIDGEKIFNGCGLGLPECSADKPCPIHHQFALVRNRLRKMMMETTIEIMVLRLQKGEAVLMH